MSARTATRRRSWLRWLFEDRETARISIASWPNLPLWTWITAQVLRWVAPSGGSLERVLGLVGSVALLVWAGLELWSGVNPWRRLLGLGVLAWLAVSSLT
jgi:hypothetical protein